MARRVGLALALILAWAALAPAQQPTALDLIPADAAAAIAVRSLDRVRTKGDKLMADARLQGVPRASDLLAELFDHVGVQAGIDLDGSGGLVLARPQKKEDRDRWGLPDRRLLVWVLPVSDSAKLAPSFGLKPGRLRPDKIIKAKLKNRDDGYLLLRGKHLYIGEDEKAVARVGRAKPLRGEVPAGRRKMLQKADLVVLINPWGFLDPEWQKALPKELESPEKAPDFVQGLGLGLAGDEKAKQALVRLCRALSETRFLIGALRIEDGLGFTLLTFFPEKGARASQELLADWRRGRGSCSLKGLPARPALAAYASRAEGPRTAALARALAALLLRNFLETEQLLSAANRPVYTEVAGEFWRQLQGSRVALYETSDERQYGLFSVVAILDVSDAAKLLANLRALARIAEEPEAKGRTKEPGPNITKLVRDLGSPRYRVRKLATLKLRLIGEPALPSLEKAKTGADLETNRRAEQLIVQIRHAANERRRDLLAKGLPRHLHPSFAFAAKPEERSGQRIEVVRVKLGRKDVPAVRQLRGLLGSDWDRVRLVAHGDQLVVLVGSEVGLLDRTLANLKAGNPGLAAAKGPAAFARRAGAQRTAELHVSMERILALTAKSGKNGLPPARAAAGGLASFGLTVGAADLQLDVWLPIEQLRVLARQIR